MIITKEYQWVMGHRLSFHKGGCQNLHGHNYRALVSVEGNVSPDTGFVMDFKDIDVVMKPMIDDLDHRFMFQKDDLIVKKICKETSLKFAEVPFHPTAENIAKAIGDFLVENKVPVSQVDLYETPKCSATWRSVDNS